MHAHSVVFGSEIDKLLFNIWLRSFLITLIVDFEAIWTYLHLVIAMRVIESQFVLLFNAKFQFLQQSNLKH